MLKVSVREVAAPPTGETARSSVFFTAAASGSSDRSSRESRLLMERISKPSSSSCAS